MSSIPLATTVPGHKGQTAGIFANSAAGFAAACATTCGSWRSSPNRLCPRHRCSRHDVPRKLPARAGSVGAKTRIAALEKTTGPRITLCSAVRLFLAYRRLAMIPPTAFSPT